VRYSYVLERGHAPGARYRFPTGGPLDTPREQSEEHKTHEPQPLCKRHYWPSFGNTKGVLRLCHRRGYGSVSGCQAREALLHLAVGDAKRS
jgi:hypothetical protein